MKIILTTLTLSFLFSNLAFADMDELFRQKAEIERQQQASQRAAEDQRDDRETNAELQSIVRTIAGKNGGLGSEPTYEYCTIDACSGRSLLNTIKFTTRNGYECEARRLDLSSTFNTEIHRHLVCIQRGTLKTINLVKVGGRWVSWR